MNGSTGACRRHRSRPSPPRRPPWRRSEEGAGPRIPAAGLIGIAILADNLEVAEPIGHVGPARRGDAHLSRPLENADSGIDAPTGVRRWKHPRQNLEGLHHQEHAGTRAGDRRLLLRPKQAHKVDDHVGVFQRINGLMAAQGVSRPGETTRTFANVEMERIGVEVLRRREEGFSVVNSYPVFREVPMRSPDFTLQSSSSLRNSSTIALSTAISSPYSAALLTDGSSAANSRPASGSPSGRSNSLSGSLLM